MYSKRSAILYLACAGWISGAGLEDWVARAVERNGEVRAAAQRIAEAQALARQAGVRPAPALEVEGSTGRATGTVGKEEYALGFSQPVETGGKRSRRLDVAAAAVELARAEWEAKSRAVAAAVQERYVEAWEPREKQRAVERLIAVSREALRLTQARVNEGDAAPLERNLLEVELQRAEAQRASFAGRFAAALLELRALAGDAVSELPGWAPPAILPALDELRRRTLDARPDLRAARMEERQAVAESGLAAAQGRPDVTLTARYAHRNERFDSFGLSASGAPVPLRDRDNVLSFGVSVPLFGRGRNQGNVEAAAARSAAARLRREQLERVAPAEVEAAWRRFDAARQTRELFDSGVLPQSQQNVEIMRQAQELGQLRMLDVLQERRRLIETELAAVEAQAEWMRAFIALERAVGGGLR